MTDLRIRSLDARDAYALRELLRAVGIFEPHEIDVAEELIDAAVAGDPDYLIHVAEATDSQIRGYRIVGYACHGHNPVTDAVHDLYWIAVDPRQQGRGIGRALIAHTEEHIRRLHARGMTIETSARREYAPARRLYEACGYRKAAEIPDFYKPGDHKLIFVKFL